MFDLAWSELLVIGLVAVLVLGPGELPQAMRTLAKALRKMRGVANEFQAHFNEMMREAELDEVRKSVQNLTSTAHLNAKANQLLDPDGKIAEELNAAVTDSAQEIKTNVTSAFEEPVPAAAPAPAVTPEPIVEQPKPAAPPADPTP